MNFNIPSDILELFRNLERANYEAFLVGGCVRDMVRGVTPQDYDIATNAQPDEVLALFPNSIPTGISFGTVTVLTENRSVEVTTYRRDADYKDGRHPDAIYRASSITEDLSRRDFTINAMACSPSGELVDPFGGRADIENRQIKAVGNPALRFEEDLLRIMRAFRFAATLGFQIEPATQKAALGACAGLDQISAERVWTELKKSLRGHHPSLLEPLINAKGLSSRGLHPAGSLQKLDLLPRDLAVRFTGLLYLCGVKTAGQVCRTLKTDNRLRALSSLYRQALGGPLPKTGAAVKRSLAHIPAERYGLYLSLRHVLLEEDIIPAQKLLRHILAKKEPYTISMLDIDGNDLLRLGIPPVKIGGILQKLLDFVIEHPEQNHKSMLIKQVVP